MTAGVHDARDVPHVLRQAPRRRRRRAPRRRARRGPRDGARRRARTGVAGATSSPEVDRQRTVHDGHAGPHESPWRITAPLVILAACAVFAGYLNAPASPFKTEHFTEWVEPRGVPVSEAEATRRCSVGRASWRRSSAPPVSGEAIAEEAGEAAEEGEQPPSRLRVRGPVDGACFAPALTHAEFKWSKAAAVDPARARSASPSACAICIGLYSRERFALKGLTDALRAGPLGLHLPRQQVLPRPPLREGHRPRHRPSDRQGRVLDQPARARRHRQRRRQGRPARPASGSTATSTSGWSTVRSTARV